MGLGKKLPKLQKNGTRSVQKKKSERRGEASVHGTAEKERTENRVTGHKICSEGKIIEWNTKH